MSVDEFETIARLLRPLAGHPAARSLMDDVAVLEPPPNRVLVLTHDTMVEGVHFWPEDRPELIARKLLRVNLSDLAAKGAEPFGYLLSCAWPERCDWAWREAFVRGLAEDQATYGLALLGGDTVSTPGPLTLGATLIGWGEPGRTPSRAGARAGDVILVSGTIGDAGLGLLAAEGDLAQFGEEDAAYFADRYWLPRPRVEVAPLVAREATASIDISDGLAADVRHIARASGLKALIELTDVPVSAAGKRWIGRHPNEADSWGRFGWSGDDYEVAFTVPPERVEVVRAEAARLGTPLAVIGHMEEGEGLEVTLRGKPHALTRLGWRHR